jgi:hypothetical protein
MSLAVQQDADQSSATGHLSAVAIHHHSVNGLHQIGLQLRNGSDVAEVVDIGGQVKQQIASGFDVQIFQQGCALRTDAANKLNGHGKPIDGVVGRVGRCLALRRIGHDRTIHSQPPYREDKQLHQDADISKLPV